VDIVLAAPPRPVEVPSLEGLTVEDAQAELEAVGLALGAQTEESSDTIEEGRIISQSPGAGEEVPKDTPVDVVVSTGQPLVTVPDVLCRTYASAKEELQGLGLQVELGEPVLPRPECPAAVNVAQQDTEPGSEVPAGTVVVLHQGLTASPSPSPSPSP
jgi:eukaryotic-like serine/threonine-protein kinase